MVPQVFAAVPAVAACLGVVLALGTAVGQSGHAGNAIDFDPMGGMDMSGMAMPGMPMNGAGSDAGAMPMDAPAMDMDDPNMAASMPGGLHATCTAGHCTVIFADTATGSAQVLGLTARLTRLRPGEVALRVGARSVVLRPGKVVTVGRTRIELTKVEPHQATVVFTRR